MFDLVRDRKVFYGRRANAIYQFLGRRFADTDDWRFMNYGYANQKGHGDIELNPDDELDRYFAQLYHQVAAQADLRGKTVVDVGSGRGGGASFIHRYHNPKTTIGVDLASSAIEFCERLYRGIDGLHFRTGDAMDLPLENESVDAVTNVESSHCYPDRFAFFAEVWRVLRPGGHFLYTDFTSNDDDLVELQERAGLRVQSQRDITSNIVLGLEVDNDRRMQFIRDKVPFGFRKATALWAASPGSWFFEDFSTARRKYLLFHSVKPQ